jgi:hypothetical protein
MGQRGINKYDSVHSAVYRKPLPNKVITAKREYEPNKSWRRGQGKHYIRGKLSWHSRETAEWGLLNENVSEEYKVTK